MMEYIFGTKIKDGHCIDTLKTISDTNVEMSGSYSIQRQYEDQVLTDSFYIVKKYNSAEDRDKYYNWYEIENHYRYTDKFTPGIKNTEQEITDQDIALIEAEQEITDLDLRVTELEGRI